MKRQRPIESYFSSKRQGREERRLLCKGTRHQGDLDGGGRQCMCVALSFLALPTPKTATDVDRNLEIGTDLYRDICNHGDCLLASEFPTTVNLDGNVYTVVQGEPKSGLMTQSQNIHEALSLNLRTALVQCFDESLTCIFTVGDSPGYSVGIKFNKSSESYVISDSHSRNDNGESASGGKAVVLRVSSLDALVKYLNDMSHSLKFSSAQPFECVPLQIHVNSDMSCDEEAEMEPEADPSGSGRTTTETRANTDPSESGRTTTETRADADPSGSGRTTTETRADADPSGSGRATTETRADAGPSGSGRTTTETRADADPSGSGRTTTETRADTDPSGSGTEEITTIPASSQQPTDETDIMHFNHANATDELKYKLICNREPDVSFKFPSKPYKDKRKKSGFMNRFCCREWFQKFEFISYSKAGDSLYCLACCLFPDSAHRRPKKLVSEGYQNWKDACSDLKSHSNHEYHLTSMAKFKAFKKTYKNPTMRIDSKLTDAATCRIKANRQVLFSIVKSLEYCGRQGIALRGHRDDDTVKGNSFNKGNFKELLTFRVDAGDNVLGDHLQNSAKNASYTSKTSQNELLLCMKQYIQDTIISQIKAQVFGSYYGIQCDEVSDASNWEQLGIVIRYIVNGTPVERLLEFVACESITGQAICDSIITALTKAGLDVNMCRSQTMDGAGNMSGKYNGCAAKFAEQSPRALYHYCSSHDLNLVLCKSCQVKEIHIMLDTLKTVGIFFKYSPKRTRRLEKSVEELNAQKPKEDQITKAKFKVFCETRWVEKITTLQVFEELYEPILQCLEAISSLERGWDTKAVTESHGLLKAITDPTFLVSFQVALHFFGYIRGLATKLQGTTMDVVRAYGLNEAVKDCISTSRRDDEEYDRVFAKCEEMADVADVTVQPPRRCGRQTQRSNVPADSPSQYFKRSIYIPFVDSLSQQFDLRFNGLTEKAIRAMFLLPSLLDQLDPPSVNDIIEFYREDIPHYRSFHQELALWRKLWNNSQSELPRDVVSTLQDERTCPIIYPCITKILHLVLLTSVTSSGVERANSALKYVKNCFRSTMGEDRFNALTLIYVHKDIPIDVDKVIDIFARKNPRKMLLTNPLE